MCFSKVFFFYKLPGHSVYMATAAVKHVLNKEKSSSEPYLTKRPSAIHLAVLISSREPLALILQFCC